MAEAVIKNVEFSNTAFLDYPHNWRQARPNIAGVIGLGAAIDFIQQLDLNETTSYTGELSTYFLEGLRSWVMRDAWDTQKNPADNHFLSDRIIHPHDVAGFLAASDIAVRAGHHCAQPLLESLGVPATVRFLFPYTIPRMMFIKQLLPWLNVKEITGRERGLEKVVFLPSSRSTA